MDFWALDVVWWFLKTLDTRFHAKKSKATNVILGCGGIEEERLKDVVRRKIPWLS